MYKIPLMKNAFLEEDNTKKALAEFMLSTNRLSMGAQCKLFEEAFALKQGRKYALLFNSGGSANLAMIQALKNLGKLKTNDHVAFSALTWSTNTMPLIQLGLNPIALDCELENLNVSSELLERRYNEAPFQMLFLTNVLGFTADIEEIRTFCAEKNILFLEDNCESLGTQLPEGKTGNFSLASSFSFYVAHHMSTIEGGMVCTDDEELAEMLSLVRSNGWDRNLEPAKQAKWRSKAKATDFEASYTFYDLGYNFRPTEITGFLGNYQLQFLDKTVDIREQNYLRISETINQNDDFLNLKHDHIRKLSTFAIPVLTKSKELREKYLKRFQTAGIETRPMIAGNMQLQPYYQKYVSNLYDTPNTDLIHNHGFYCGNYPELTDDDLSVIKKALEA